MNPLLSGFIIHRRHYRLAPCRAVATGCGDRTRTYTVSAYGADELPLLHSALCEAVCGGVGTLPDIPLLRPLLSVYIISHVKRTKRTNLRIILDISMTRNPNTIFSVIAALNHSYCRPSFALYIMQPEHRSVIFLTIAQIRLYGVQTPQ